jgi:uncharacterized protein YjbI with pentapeptide repeats
MACMAPRSQNSAGAFQRLPVEDLERILHAHSAFVSRVTGGQRALLKACDLKGANLSNRMLSDADLSGSVLSGANLRFTEFVGANLFCCDLHGADGSYANFSHADLRGAVLSGCNLAHARLNCADCRPGRMLQKSDSGLQDVIDPETAAAGASFSHSLLNDVDFENARLEGADFSGAIIQASHFKGASLKNAVFQDAVLSGVDISEMQVPAAVLKTCIVAPSERSVSARAHQLEKLKAHQHWIETDGHEGVAAAFDGEDLRPLADMVRRCKLTAISAKSAVAVVMDFSGCELQGANFENADLRGANFENADLRGVRFHNARLEHARFGGADLRPLALHSGEYLSCDFTGAEMAEDQLETAIRS